MSSSTNFQNVLDALGISDSQLPDAPVSTSQTSRTLSGDPSTSLLLPHKVTFKTEADRDNYLALVGIDGSTHANFPLDVTAFAVRELTVTAGTSLMVEAAKDQHPVVLNIGTLTLESDGDIQCISSLVATIDTLNKE